MYKMYLISEDDSKGQLFALSLLHEHSLEQPGLQKLLSQFEDVF